MPSSSASTGISIFIDSRITTVSPSSTRSPTATSIFHTVPVMWASTCGHAMLGAHDIDTPVDAAPSIAYTASVREHGPATGTMIIVVRRDLSSRGERRTGERKRRAGLLDDPARRDPPAGTLPPMSQPELAELKEQDYKDPRPKEHFDRFHERTRTREPDFVYEVVPDPDEPDGVDLLPRARDHRRAGARPPAR